MPTRQLRGLARTLSAVTALSVAACAASGQSKPSSSPATAATASAAQPVPVVPPPGHGWFAWRDSADRATIVLHLPPRTAESAEDISDRDGRADGSVRLAPGIAQSVEHIAWWQHRVYLVLQEDRTAPAERSDWLRRIVGLTAVRSSVTGGWQYPPGRPVVVATMGARSREVIAFGACRLGPVVLLRHGARSQWESGAAGRAAAPPVAGGGKSPGPAATGEAVRPPAPGDLELAVHVGSSWRRLELPWAGAASASEAGRSSARPFSTFWLSGEGDELTLFAFDQSASAIQSFTTKLPLVPPSANATAAVSTTWMAATWPLTDRSGNTLPKPDTMACVDGVIVGAAWSKGSGGDGELRMFVWTRPDGGAVAGGGTGMAPQEVPRVTGVPAQHRVVPMDGSGRVAIVWAEEPAAAAQAPKLPGGADVGHRAGEAGGGGGTVGSRGSGRIGFQIREVSVVTGAVLYAGPLRADYWLSMREYQLLALMLVLVMGSIVVFVLRADPAAVPTLPTGVTLAEPGRRALAAAIDFLPSALFVEALWALPSGTLFLPSRMAGEQFSIVALLVALGLACVHATLAEWMFGRSIGKLLTGCAVAGVRRPAAGSPAAGTGKPGAAETSAGPQLELGRPALWQCLVRNLVKWAAPALGVFILFDPSRRHPGDVLARTLVLLNQTSKPE